VLQRVFCDPPLIHAFRHRNDMALPLSGDPGFFSSGHGTPPGNLWDAKSAEP